MKPVSLASALFTLSTLLAAGVASTALLVWSETFPAPLRGGPLPVPPVNAALAEARGWSGVTLVGVVPLSALALWFARRGSLSGRLIWLGTLAYFVYTYLEFAVSPPFTALFLVYVVAFASALVALIMGVASTEIDEVASAFGERAPRRSVVVFSLVVGVGLSLAWLKGIVVRTWAGDFGWPEGIDAIGHVVHALDLGLQVPLALATAVLLLGRRPAGYVVASIMLVNAACMAAALTAMVASSAVAAGRSVFEAMPFAVLALVAVGLTLSYFKAARGRVRAIMRTAPKNAWPAA